MDFSSCSNLFLTSSLSNDLIKIKVKEFVCKNISSKYGYMRNVMKDVDEELYNIVIFSLENCPYQIVNKFNILKVIEIVKKNKNLFFINQTENSYHFIDYFENKINIFASKIISNYYFEFIATLLNKIYIYGTTTESVKEYLKFADMNYILTIDGISEKNLNEINEYVINLPFWLKTEKTLLAYKILSLAHLISIHIDNKKILIENLNVGYARITLQLTKNEPCILLETYKELNDEFIVPSTPMFYYSLKRKNLMSSCFLINIEDSIESIALATSKLMHIQKYNAGVGINVSKIRDKNKAIDKNDIFKTKSITNILDIFGLISKNFKNFSRQRSASINVNLALDHPYIIEFLDLKKNTHIREGLNTTDLFQTILIPDEFIYRYLKKDYWYFISPEQSKNGKYLYEVYGNEYSKLYNEMINDDKIVKNCIKAEDLMNKIVNTLVSTGGPCMLMKDVINETSNQKIYGNITCSNLCTEIFEVNNEMETACCNLMSLNLKKFVNNEKFNFDKLEKIVSLATVLLDQSIDVGFYSHSSTETSNKKLRPMGLGIQGLYEMLLEIYGNNFDFINNMEEYEKLYREILEKMYFTALKSSVILSKKSNVNKHKLANNLFNFEQYELYQKNKINNLKKQGINFKKIFDYIDINSYKKLLTIPQNELEKLRNDINEFGLKNTLFIALMPTSLSSCIYDNSESFEFPSYNICIKNLANFDYILYNKYLIENLMKNENVNEENVLITLEKLKNTDELFIKNKISNRFPTLYNEDFDLFQYSKMMHSVNPFIDQGKSFNIYVKNNKKENIVLQILLAWASGAKSTYYYRTEIEINPLVYTDIKNIESIENDCAACSA